MNRDELIEIGVQAARNAGGCVDGMDAILDAVAPLIRADERAAIMSRVKQDMTVDREKWTVLARSTSRADLRAKVEALVTPQGVGSWNSAMEAVLDLIDGGE